MTDKTLTEQINELEIAYKNLKKDYDDLLAALRAKNIAVARAPQGFMIFTDFRAEAQDSVTK